MDNKERACTFCEVVAVAFYTSREGEPYCYACVDKHQCYRCDGFSKSEDLVEEGEDCSGMCRPCGEDMRELGMEEIRRSFENKGMVDIGEYVVGCIERNYYRETEYEYIRIERFEQVLDTIEIRNLTRICKVDLENFLNDPFNNSYDYAIGHRFYLKRLDEIVVPFEEFRSLWQENPKED